MFTKNNEIFTHLGFIKRCKDNKAGWALTGGICGASAAIACHDNKRSIEMMGQIMAHEIGHVLGNIRVIYDRVLNEKNNFEDSSFFMFERGKSRAGNSK